MFDGGNLNETIIIVGASARAWAQSAARTGRHVIAVDQFADFDTRQCAKTLNRDELLRFLKNQDSDAPACLIAYSGGLENEPELVRELEKQGHLLGNGSSVLSRLLDRPGTFHWLYDNGFQVPRFFSPGKPVFESKSDPGRGQGDTVERRGASVSSTGRRYLRKRILSCGGLGISRIQLPSDDELRHHEDPPLEGPPQDDPLHGDPLHDPNALASTGQDYWFQEYIEGQNLSAMYLATPDTGSVKAKLMGLTEQLNGDPRFNAPGFLYTGSINVPHPDQELVHFAESIGNALANRYQLKGLFNIDFIRTSNEFYFLEINPRFTASMELWERSCSTNLFQVQHAVCHSGRRPPSIDEILSLPTLISGVDGEGAAGIRKDRNPNPGQQPVSGKAVWYADATVQVGESFTRFASDETDDAGWPLISDIPSPGVILEKGHPCFTVFAKGETAEETVNQLQQSARRYWEKIHSLA